ncbi:bark storage protein A-like [Chenopodium quinoa]|uniref:bark storage protein A-like n=1 Tax=Chenopodium quinoa TaxID=63459 RepID=UPI000B76FE10|nr:bark storage protein A-like [Chenopodium quinoa]
MAREMLGVAIVIGLLLAMVPNTMQLPLHRPDIDGPFIGLILSGSSYEKLLLDSGLYVPEPETSLIQIAGRTFNIGTFNGVPTIYVVSTSPLAHVSATVQILVDHFHILGIIDLGNAAVVSPSVKLADVAVLDKTSFISAWTWKEYEGGIETSNELPSLRFGDYNVPEAGDNKLGSLQFLKIKKYTPKGSNKETFWYYIDPEWLEMASQLKDINLESCTEERLCTKDVPSVVYRVKGASSDAYVLNHAYGKFLNKHLNVSTVDRKSAAVVSTAVANGVKHIVFRGASNKPGMPYDKKLSALATKNSFKVASKFVELLANQLPLIKYKY